MDERSTGAIFDSYCYGPADIVRIRKGDNTMYLSLVDTAGRRASAIYSGCVYWRLEPEQTGIHLSLAEQVTADELLLRRDSATLQALEKNTDHVEKLIREWEGSGLSFYLHLCSHPDTEFLVVAKRLHYEELD